jgi:hypothetical protein
MSAVVVAVLLGTINLMFHVLVFMFPAFLLYFIHRFVVSEGVILISLFLAHMISVGDLLEHVNKQ